MSRCVRSAPSERRHPSGQCTRVARGLRTHTVLPFTRATYPRWTGWTTLEPADDFAVFVEIDAEPGRTLAEAGHRAHFPHICVDEARPHRGTHFTDQQVETFGSPD